MGKFDIGDYIGDRVRGHHSTVDTDAIFAKLNLEKKKKKRRFLIWWFGIITTLITVVSIINYNKIKNQENLVSEKSLEAKPITSTKNSSIPVSNFKQPKDHVTKTTSSSSDLITERIEDTTNSPLVLPKPTHQNNITTIDRLTNSTSAKINESNKNSIQTKTSLQSQTQTPTLNKVTKEIIANNSKAILISPLPPNFLHQKREISTELKFNSLDDFKNNSKSSSSKYEVILKSGVFRVNKQLETSDPALVDHIKQRESSEQPLEMVNLSTTLRLTRHSGLFLESGFDYAVINERFDLQQLSTDTILELRPIRFLINASQDTTVLEVGLDQTEILNQSKWRQFNKHQLYTIPLSLGYTKSINRWKAEVQGTTLLSYRTFSGIQLDLNGLPSSSLSYHQSSLKVGMRIAFGISYALGEKWNLHFQPTYQYYWTSFVDNEAGYSLNYHLYGLQLGLGYRLR